MNKNRILPCGADGIPRCGGATVSTPGGPDLTAAPHYSSALVRLPYRPAIGNQWPGTPRLPATGNQSPTIPQPPAGPWSDVTPHEWNRFRRAARLRTKPRLAYINGGTDATQHILRRTHLLNDSLCVRVFLRRILHRRRTPHRRVSSSFFLRFLIFSKHFFSPRTIYRSGPRPKISPNSLRVISRVFFLFFKHFFSASAYENLAFSPKFPRDCSRFFFFHRTFFRLCPLAIASPSARFIALVRVRKSRVLAEFLRRFLTWFFCFKHFFFRPLAARRIL